MHARLSLIAAAALPLLIQCAGADILEPDDAPNAKKAYLFGRFAHRVAQHGGTAALALRNANTGVEYVVKFRRKGAVHALPVEPGTYKITEVVYLTGIGRERGRRLFLPPAPFKYMGELFQAPAGTLTYLGDFGASTLARGKDHIWRFHSIRDRFDKTRGEFAAEYPLLRAEYPVRRAFKK